MEAPVSKGDVLGTMTVSLDGIEYGTVNLVAANDVSQSAWLARKAALQNLFSKVWVRILAVVILVALSTWSCASRCSTADTAPTAGGNGAAPVATVADAAEESNPARKTIKIEKRPCFQTGDRGVFRYKTEKATGNPRCPDKNQLTIYHKYSIIKRYCRFCKK